VLVAMLHPTREALLSFGRPDRTLAGLAVLTAIPGVPFILDNIHKQRLNLLGDSHAELEHWLTMALFAALVLLWGLIASTKLTGWRITAWLAGLAAAAFGVASLVFPLTSSAAGTGWAIVAIVWGVGFITMSERRAHHVAPGSLEAGLEKQPA